MGNFLDDGWFDDLVDASVDPGFVGAEFVAEPGDGVDGVGDDRGGHSREMEGDRNFFIYFFKIWQKNATPS